MRKEPFGVGSIVHVVKRGARGLPFLRTQSDRERVLLMLAHFNDTAARPFWLRDIMQEDKGTMFERPSAWGKKENIVTVHAFCLQKNHFHLLLEEVEEGGIAMFMRKIGNGIAGYINEKYKEHGSPFQGAYKSRTVDSDAYLRYVFAYIEVKNAFEQFPGGYKAATKNFNAAYEWTLQFPSSSLLDHMGRSDLHKEGRGIVSRELFTDLWGTRREHAIFAKDVIEGRAHLGTDPRAFSGVFL